MRAIVYLRTAGWPPAHLRLSPQCDRPVRAVRAVRCIAERHRCIECRASKRDAMGQAALAIAKKFESNNPYSPVPGEPGSVTSALQSPMQFTRCIRHGKRPAPFLVCTRSGQAWFQPTIPLGLPDKAVCLVSIRSYHFLSCAPRIVLHHVRETGESAEMP